MAHQLIETPDIPVASGRFTLQSIVEAAPPPKAAYAYTKYGTYPAAYLLAYTALRFGISANTLTWLDFVVTMSAVIGLVSAGPVVSPGIAVCAWALLTLGYMLDSADGQVARVSRTVSPLGEWLDHALDVAKHVTVNLTYGWLLFGGGSSIPRRADYLLISASLLSMEVAFFASMLRSKLEVACRCRVPAARGRLERIFRIPAHLGDYGIFVCFTLLLPWLNWFRFAFGMYVAICFTVRCGRVIRSGLKLAKLNTP